MKKFIRLTKEFFFALFALKNPFAYYIERAGISLSPKLKLEFWNGAIYSLHSGTDEIYMINEIWNTKVYDRLTTAIRSGSTVIDIGANVGIFSIKAAKIAKDVRVISYEPFPSSFAQLKENISLNGLDAKIFPHNKAVSGKRGELELFFRKNDPGGVSMYQHGKREELSSTKVSAITLEDVFRDNNIEFCDFMKMDCEGAEKEILLNVPRELFRRIKSITLEWHQDLNKMSTEEFRKFLGNLGYKTYWIQETLTLYAWRE